MLSSEIKVLTNQNDTDPGATGVIVVFTVPADEFWEIFYQHFAGSAATITGSYLQVSDQLGSFITLKSPTAAQQVIYEWTHPLLLPPGAQCRVNIAAYNALDTFDFRTFAKVTKRS